MESFACLIQTHAGQDEEGTRREREMEGERDLQEQAERIGEGKTQSTRKRLLRQVDREERTRGSGQEKIAPQLPTAHHHMSVFIKRIVSISSGVEAFISPCRCLMS